MNAGNRFLLIIYALVTTILAVAAMLWLIDCTWFSDLCLIISDQVFFWQFAWLILIIYVLAGLHFIWAALSGWEDKNLIISDQEPGKISIIKEAVEEFAKKILLQHENIQEAVAKLKVKSGVMQIQTQIRVTPETIVPDFSNELQEEINSKIQETIGLKIQKVEILVQEIAAEAPASAQRKQGKA